jgi:hypothetical protein
MSRDGPKADVSAAPAYPRVVDLSRLDGAFLEIVEQACIDAHLAEVFAKRFPQPQCGQWWIPIIRSPHT